MSKKISNDELFFQENGYLIKKIEDIKSLNYIFKKFEDSIYLEKKLKNKKIKLNKLHKHINKLSLNNIRVSLIKKINCEKILSIIFWLVYQAVTCFFFFFI